MASYAVGVSELLLAPPPPPPPPPSISSGPAVSSQERIEPSQQHQSTYPPHHGQPPNVLMQNMSVPPPSSPSNVAMIPPSHFSLPPPPPPPPLEANSEHQNSGAYRKQFPNNFNSPRPIRPRPASHRPHPYRGGPPPWSAPPPAPAGLQGPWQPPRSDRPSGMFQHLHPPGVPLEHHSVGEVSTAENNAGPPVEKEIDTSEDNIDSSNFTPASTTYKDHKVDPKDPRLPRELTDLFEALNCKLCGVVSSSTVQAKHHYSGKPHDKKVRQWLLKWSEETGQPIPKRPKIETPVASVSPEDLYCKLCEVAFTSVKHGEQHKMGKPHQKALKLGYNPARPKAKKLVEVPFDPTGRFGIGETFRKDLPTSSTDTSQPEVSQEAFPLASSPAVKTNTMNSKFYCDLCKINTTSQDHLDAHFNGAKHRKNLVNAARAEIKPDTSVVPPPVEPAESILASVIGQGDLSCRSKSMSSDLSIYRTPSGQFYCHPCNTTVNSEKTFKEHTESKRHKFKVASSKRL